MALCLLVGIADGLLTLPHLASWYNHLVKPPLTPTGLIFGPIWTALYVMMAGAAWLVWRQPQHQRALSVWGWQLAFNAAWAPIFFAAHLLLPGLLVILALDVLIIMTMGRFSRRDRRASWLMAPYLAWSLFGTYLNLGFWWLNR